MAVRASTDPSSAGIPFWRDLRFWQVFLQISFVIIILVVGYVGVNNIVSALAANNQTPNFAFLGTEQASTLAAHPTTRQMIASSRRFWSGFATPSVW
jgi:ABC-type amino acid transport system permease subunit